MAQAEMPKEHSARGQAVRPDSLTLGRLPAKGATRRQILAQIAAELRDIKLDREYDTGSRIGRSRPSAYGFSRPTGPWAHFR